MLTESEIKEIEKVENEDDDNESIWNHRVIKFPDGTLQIVEVHYDSNRKPKMYSDAFLCAETIKGLNELLTWMKNCLKAPILDSTIFKTKKE